MNRRRFLAGTGIGLTAILLRSSIAQATPNNYLKRKIVNKTFNLNTPTDVLSNTNLHNCVFNIYENGSLNFVGNSITMSYCRINMLNNEPIRISI